MLGAEEITFLSPGLGFLSALLLFHLSRQEEKANCTYIDLCTIEAILVHHPVKLENRKGVLVDLEYMLPS